MRTTKELRDLFITAVQESRNLYMTTSGHSSSRDGYFSAIYSIYFKMFGKWPYEWNICQFLQPNNGYEKFTKEDWKFAQKFIKGYSEETKVDFTGTVYAIQDYYAGNSYVVQCAGITMVIIDEYIVYHCQESSFGILCPDFTTLTEEEMAIETDKIHKVNIEFMGDVFGRKYMLYNEPKEGAELPKEVFDINRHIKYISVDKKEETPTYQYLIHDNSGFKTMEMNIKQEVNIAIDENYNDDFPYQKMWDFLNADNMSGLAIMHGEPGTGKTYFLRHLLSQMKDRTFMIINEGALAHINDPSFIRLLFNNKNSVIVLEDCEKVLTDRNNGNALIGTLLNLTDGLLADSFNIKFICTFNAQLSRIDKAVMRKGRLKIKYEFGKLSADKTYALGQKLGKNIPKGVSLTLADIYNYDEEVELGVKKNKGMGFVNTNK